MCLFAHVHLAIEECCISNHCGHNGYCQYEVHHNLNPFFLLLSLILFTWIYIVARDTPALFFCSIGKRAYLLLLMSIVIPIVVASANATTATTINPNIAIILILSSFVIILRSIFTLAKVMPFFCVRTQKEGLVLFSLCFIDLNQLLAVCQWHVTSVRNRLALRPTSWFPT